MLELANLVSRSGSKWKQICMFREINGRTSRDRAPMQIKVFALLLFPRLGLNVKVEPWLPRLRLHLFHCQFIGLITYVEFIEYAWGMPVFRCVPSGFSHVYFRFCSQLFENHLQYYTIFVRPKHVVFLVKDDDIVSERL